MLVVRAVAINENALGQWRIDQALRSPFAREALVLVIRHGILVVSAKTIGRPGPIGLFRGIGISVRAI